MNFTTSHFVQFPANFVDFKDDLICIVLRRHAGS